MQHVGARADHLRVQPAGRLVGGGEQPRSACRVGVDRGELQAEAAGPLRPDELGRLLARRQPHRHRRRRFQSLFDVFVYFFVLVYGLLFGIETNEPASKAILKIFSVF